MIFKFLPGSMSLVQDSAADLFFPTQAPDGTAIDVSSGYTARFVVYTLQQPDRAGHVYVESAAITFSTTGVALSLTAADVNTMHASSYGYQVNISNDAFAADNHMIAAGQAQIVPSAFAV